MKEKCKERHTLLEKEKWWHNENQFIIWI